MERFTYLNWLTVVCLALATVLSTVAGRAQTFLSAPINLSSTGHAALPAIAVGPGGDIDAAWFDSGAILFRRSLDGGQTFSATMTIATTDLPSQASQPQIAVNSVGVYVAWAGTNNNGGGDIFFTSLANGTSSWTAPVNVSGGLGIASGGSAPVPRIAVDPGGGVDLVWGQNAAYFARSTNGGNSFTTTTPPLTSSPMAKESPRMAINSQGHVFVVWENADPNFPTSNCPKIVFARSTDGGVSFKDYSVADDLTVNGQKVTGCTSDVQIAVGASNTIWLIWANENPNIQDLVITYAIDQDPFSTDSSFPEAYFDNLSSTASHTPQMAIDGSGNISVVWIGDDHLNDPTHEVVYFDRSTDPQRRGTFCGGANNPTCASPPVLTTPPTGSLQPGFPQVAAEPSRAIDVIWQQASTANPGGAYDIVLARSSDGLNFATATLSNAPTTASGSGQIAVDASGNVFAVWQGSSGSGGDVLVNGDSAGLAAGSQFSLSQVTASISPASAVVNVGGSASFSLSLSSKNSVSGSVTLACGGAPAGVSCSFSPETVALPENGTATATLKVSASVKPSTSMARRGTTGKFEASPKGLAVCMWVIGLLVFFVMIFARESIASGSRSQTSHRGILSNNRWALALALPLAMLLAAAATMMSCGGSTNSGGGGGSITFPLTVQGQSNSASVNLQTISITVP
jgi:hypothetical protein